MVEPGSRSPVYFCSLELQNVRCFGERQVLKLLDGENRLAQWTLLLGDNGVGKTTLLECLAWMQPVPDSQLDKPNEPNEPNEPNKIGVPLTNEENDVLNSLLRLGAEVTLDLKATLSLGHKLGTATQPERRVETCVQMKGKDGQLDELTSTNGDGDFPSDLEVPIFCYGAARHMGVKNLDKGQLADSTVARFSNSTELYDAEEMLLNLDYLALKAGRDNSSQGKRLEEVKRILSRILPDATSEGDIEILGPKPLGPSDKPGGVRFKTPYGCVPLSGLSLGYETTLAWVLDLATRLIGFYPDSAEPLAEPAVVLVDEIDLHLHPRWQRQIMTDLTEHFCATQFIATAHSPLMVQSGTDANLVVLQRVGDQVTINNEPHFIEGWRADQILTSELFGVPARGPRIQRLIEERRKLLNAVERTPADEQRLQELDELLDNLPTGSRPEDDKAMEIIRRAAELIRQQGNPVPDDTSLKGSTSRDPN